MGCGACIAPTLHGCCVAWVYDGGGVSCPARSLHMRIPGGASGHETDKRSPSSPANTHLIARGMNPDRGGAEIVHFDTDSGGEVFSVGSITWSASVLVDDVVSAMTANVLRRFTS